MSNGTPITITATTITRPSKPIPRGQRGYYDIMETAVRELLIGKQLFTAAEIRRQIEVHRFAHSDARR